MLDIEDEEEENIEEDNEIYELRDDEEKKETKVDPVVQQKVAAVSTPTERPSLVRADSQGSRRSVRFGMGDEVKVEEYSYEDLELGGRLLFLSSTLVPLLLIGINFLSRMPIKFM